MVETQNICGLDVARRPPVREPCRNYGRREDDHTQAGWIIVTSVQRTRDRGLALKDARMQTRERSREAVQGQGDVGTVLGDTRVIRTESHGGDWVQEEQSDSKALETRQRNSDLLWWAEQN